MASTSTVATADVSTRAARGLLAELVAIPSPSGDERAAAERLAGFFAAHDREVWLDDTGNVRAPADDAVLLTSHVDTVPGDVPVCVTTDDATVDDAAAVAATGSEEGPLPTNGTGLASDDAVLWGRGSVDATGSLAAMAVAAVETGVSFVGVVGEETDSRGARHLVDDRAAPEAVVNGEPSGWDALTLGYRGFLPATYSVSTEAGHSSRPEPNAVQHATAWVERVQDAFEDDGEAVSAPSDDGDENASSVFESVTAKPVAIDGGVTDDGTAVAATVDCQFRIPPTSSADEIQETVASVTDVGGVTDVGDLSWGDAIPPHTASARSDLARAFRVAIRDAGGDPRLLRKTGTADANLYDATWDCPVVTYGPGDSALDHAPDERLALTAYDRAIAVLEAVAIDQQGGPTA